MPAKSPAWVGAGGVKGSRVEVAGTVGYRSDKGARMTPQPQDPRKRLKAQRKKTVRKLEVRKRRLIAMVKRGAVK